MVFNTLMTGALLSVQTVIPNKAVLNLHYLDRTYTPSTACPGGQVQVSGPRFVEKGLNEEGLAGIAERPVGDGLSKTENHFCVSMDVLAKEREWGKSVYRTRVATGTKNEGTSFLVARNVIMTNNHIAVPLPKDPTDCRAVEVLTRTEHPQWVGCKKILYCNADYDFCFVEMKSVLPGVELGDLSRPLGMNPAPIGDQDAYLIGNSSALGIQASKGPVTTRWINLKAGHVASGKVIHYIPMTGGASGSPILNENGEVIAINHSHYAFDGKVNDYVDPDGDTFNIGTTMQTVFNDFNARLHAPSILRR